MQFVGTGLNLAGWNATFASVEIDGGYIYQASSAGVREVWNTPTLGAQWSFTDTYDGVTGFQALRYRRDIQGNVWLNGMVFCNTVPAATVFTLPAGYFSPNQKQAFFVQEFKAATSAHFTGLGHVQTDGQVLISTQMGFTRAANDQFYFNGVIRTDQT